MMISTSLVLLTSAATENELPSQFRLFRRGVNESTKGSFVFDTEAAALVMTEYNKHGADVHIDLEHLALDPESASYDPDARGWARLAVIDGELWAVDVRWTADGARRLAEKTQRYISPAFYTDKDGRVTKIINIALTGLPATHQPGQLVAANQPGKRTMLQKLNMSPELAEKAMAAIAAGDEKAALEILTEQMTMAAAGGETPPEVVENPAASEAMAPVEEMSEDGAAEEEEKKEELAALRSIVAVTRSHSARDAEAQVVSWSKRIADVEEREQRLELSERRALTAALVRAGAELPSTAWEGDAKDQKPVARLLSEDLDGLRARVRLFTAARKPAVKPPVTEASVHKLSSRDLEICKARGIKPEDFAQMKASAVRRVN